MNEPVILVGGRLLDITTWELHDAPAHTGLKAHRNPAGFWINHDDLILEASFKMFDGPCLIVETSFIGEPEDNMCVRICETVEVNKRLASSRAGDWSVSDTQHGLLLLAIALYEICHIDADIHDIQDYLLSELFMLVDTGNNDVNDENLPPEAACL